MTVIRRKDSKGRFAEWTIYTCRKCGTIRTEDPCDHCGDDGPSRYTTVVREDHLRGAVDALRVIANDTTHDGRWAASRAERALVAMGVDPRAAGGQ
jgi:hypothetical protein